MEKLNIDNKLILEDLIYSSKNYLEVFEKTGIKRSGYAYRLIQKYVNLYNIDTSHFIDSRSPKKQKIIQIIDETNLRRIRTDKKCSCGTILSKKEAECCKKCYDNKKHNQGKTRPSIEQLKQDIETLGYTGTGRKYGVSDNAIRKWVKNKNEN